MRCFASLCVVALFLSSCGPGVTEVVVVVDADAAVAARARYLAVRVFDSEGRVALDRVDDLRSDVSFPARIPLTPKDGDPTRRWRVEVDAQNAFGCVFASVSAEGGYTRGFAETRSLTLTPLVPDPCPPGPGCGGGCDDGLACTEDSCVEERCLNEPEPGVCAVDGSCAPSGSPSPGDPCRVCDPEASSLAWTLASGCDSAEVARFDAPFARYGEALAVRDKAVLVGAPEADGGRGRAFALHLGRDGAWVEAGEVAPRELGSGARFGAGVAVSGSWALVGAPGDGTGRVFAFRREGARWTPAGELVAAGLAPADRFGASVALDGDLAVVGAPYSEAPVSESGAVYVFRRAAGDRWTEVARVAPPEPEAGAFFGEAVGLSGDRFVVGSRYHDEGGEESAGAAYAYQVVGEEVSAPLPLEPSHTQAFGYFGHSVAIDGARVAVSASQDDSFSSDGGAVYVFDVAAADPASTAQLGMGPAGAQAGVGLAVSGPLVAIGFPFSDAGRFVTVFEEVDGSFTARPRVTGDGSSRVFGRAVALSDRWMAVGAPGADQGTVYVFEIRR